MTLSQPTPQRRGETGVFRMIWPVLELLPLDDLVDEASESVPALCRMSRVRIVGRPRWSIRRGQDVPGSGGAQWVLLCDAPVVRIERQRDSMTGELDKTLRKAS